MILQETFTLANGVTVPKLGLGTWFISDDKVAQAVRDAVEIGYRHIDTAQAYENERGVGEGVRNSGVLRDELFITTKLRAEYKTHAASVAAIDGSLRALALDHIDLMIIHSPQPWAEFKAGERFFEGNLEAWRALEDAYKAGKLRAIGVSNFDPVDVDNLIKNGSVKPMVNQVLAHVGNTPFNVIDHGKANGVLIEAYSPVAHGATLNHPAIAEMAQSYGVSVPQLCIRYCLDLGMLPLPKTANPTHMRENAKLDFSISAEDLKTLKGLAPIDDYGDASRFPVFSGKLQDGARQLAVVAVGGGVAAK
ncbi:aldo/keto reductase [Paradevosia shaoguanensis]|uniref:Aldo/keto reductase n=1 Tax=Paradevosia shaoguanensis TaxID=1335043 RepID=A0AA41QPE5_9HYPH|nr:aldo/keto reductase [Paradevosia shaoguanensis]MCF1742753.1 aldo/keto reductase [Paradevosia shaoguanensis]MCI0127236.1 aldo/keto reductase [Paradevosia shaoguanensis]